MKSAVFYAKHDVRIEEIPQPPVGENDVLVKVAACGVCGTDVHIFEGDKGAAEVTPPTILGHEFAGTVEEVGKKVKGFAVGDKVAVDPNDWCGECYYCREGLAHFCERMRGIGTTVDGGFAQYCAVPARQAVKLAPDASLSACAMAEPVACCLHGFDMCGVKAGSTVMVIGGGMIGLIMVQLAKIAGACAIVLLEPVAAKRAMGQKLGADIVIDPLREDVRGVLAAHGLHRIETIIECAGRKETIEEAVHLAGKASTLMMFGLTRPDDEIAIKPFEIFQKEVVLKASFINPYTQQRAVDLIQSGKIDVESMVVEVCTLEKLPQVLADPALRAAGKYIVDPWKTE